MSKIAHYLNEHLLGSVSSLTTLRQSYATDGSILEVVPELVAYPKSTNDVRKIARFSWQLAEKGHVLSIIARGLGGDTTGGAIGSGIMIDTTKYLNAILYVSTKDKSKVVHAQPGVTLRTLHETLRWNGLTLGAYSPDIDDMTIGGAIASAVRTYRSGKYGMVADSIERMEVVLANGDLMEVGRINKREVSKKQGEQTLEGEIYRQIDGIIEEYAELIARLSSEHDNIGYRIDQVRAKDGSFDLTPLFVGSQGTLGIISEVILKTDFYSDEESAIVVSCPSFDDARDIAELVQQLEPAVVQLIDGAYLRAASARGKRFVLGENDDPQAILYVSFDDFSDKIRERKLKKITKLLAKRDVRQYTSDEQRIEELYAMRDADQVATTPQRIDEVYVSVCDGAYIPSERLGDFASEVAALAAKHHVELPLRIDGLTGVVSTKTLMHLKKVSDKQKVFKLMSEYAALVARMGGSIAGAHAEGRLGAYAGYELLDAEIITLNAKIRKAFDPFGTLNPGVKQQADLRVLARQLKSD